MPKTLINEVLMLKIHSQIPADEIDVINGQPFVFQIGNQIFEVPALTLDRYVKMEKHLHVSLSALYYYGVELNPSLQTLLKVDQDHVYALNRAWSVIKLILSVIKPLSKLRMMYLIASNNLKHWNHPTEWVFSVNGFMRKNLNMMDIINLASYLMRYMSEVKKKIFQILQKGIESVTRDLPVANQDTNHSSEEEFKPGFHTIGQDLLDMASAG